MPAHGLEEWWADRCGRLEMDVQVQWPMGGDASRFGPIFPKMP